MICVVARIVDRQYSLFSRLGQSRRHIGDVETEGVVVGSMSSRLEVKTLESAVLCANPSWVSALKSWHFADIAPTHLC